MKKDPAVALLKHSNILLSSHGHRNTIQLPIKVMNAMVLSKSSSANSATNQETD